MAEWVTPAPDFLRCVHGGPVAPEHHCWAVVYVGLLCAACETDTGCDCPACLIGPCSAECAARDHKPEGDR